MPPCRLAAFLRWVRGQFVRRRLWRLPRLERAPLRPERELPRDPDRPAGAPSGCPPGKCNLDLCGSLRSPDPAAGRLLPCRWPPPARAVRTVAPSQVRVVPRARRRSQPMQGALCSSPQVTADWSNGRWAPNWRAAAALVALRFVVGGAWSLYSQQGLPSSARPEPASRRLSTCARTIPAASGRHQHRRPRHCRGICRSGFAGRCHM